MGQFSWLDCCNKRPIVTGLKKPSYLLVPEEFRGTYGDKIKENAYNGYGSFGGVDAYELVALMNRDYLTKEHLIVPKREEYSDKGITEGYFESAMRRYEARCKKLADFTNKELSDVQMQEKYGNDYLREIGIDIACYDEQNAVLKYPIKITYNPDAVYEKCPYSLGDPDQGTSYFSEEQLKTDTGKKFARIVEQCVDRCAESVGNELDEYDVLFRIRLAFTRLEFSGKEPSVEALDRELAFIEEFYFKKGEINALFSFYQEVMQYDPGYSVMEDPTMELD